jgi:hypothetical protein
VVDVCRCQCGQERRRASLPRLGRDSPLGLAPLDLALRQHTIKPARLAPLGIGLEIRTDDQRDHISQRQAAIAIIPRRKWHRPVRKERPARSHSASGDDDWHAGRLLVMISTVNAPKRAVACRYKRWIRQVYMKINTSEMQ